MGQVPVLSFVDMRLSRIAASDRHDAAFVEEGVRNQQGLLQQTAGIVTKVQDEALEVRAGRLLDGVDRLLELG